MRPGTDVSEVGIPRAVEQHAPGLARTVAVVLKIQRRERWHQFLYVGTNQNDAVGVRSPAGQTDQYKRRDDEHYLGQKLHDSLSLFVVNLLTTQFAPRSDRGLAFSGGYVLMKWLKKPNFQEQIERAFQKTRAEGGPEAEFVADAFRDRVRGRKSLAYEAFVRFS